MAATSSQTQAAVSTTLLPTSLLEAQVLLFSNAFRREIILLLCFILNILRITMGPVLFQHFLILAHWSLSVFLSGLHIPSQMAVRTLQVLLESPAPTESEEIYNVFEEAAPFLLYLRDFWMGRANCPLFAEHILLTAEHLSHSLPAFLRDDLEQQWGIPPEHRSPGSGVLNLEQFPAIPIPFFLRFREGSTIMCMVPSKDLDPFTSLRGQGVLPGVPKIASPSKVSDVIPPSSTTKAPAVPPRVLRRNREVESLKADASSFLASPRSIRSKDSDNKCPSSFPLVDAAPQVSSSAKVSLKILRPPVLLLLVRFTKGFDFLLVRGKIL
ncbi:hypothetical protein C8R41DRAFT_863229 [Lentinula lateritia]|uniref:Uncharacterized protein n=1 Tax=Lentinula lateritia TaxID=40482 RepID=A0ABQ8W036_9AGAR|nr:hypothetical protein C8R41DRAFT_863229 [Lentinula lateritia]